MAGSRQFTNATDALNFALSSPNPTAAITLLVVVNPEAANNTTFLSTAVNQPEFGRQVDGDLYYWYDAARNVNGTAVTRPFTNRWQVLAVTKGAGTVRPRFHRIAFDGTAPAHEEAATALVDMTPTGSWNVGSDGGPSWTLKGRIAAWAVWNSALSDALIESCRSWAGIVALAPARAARLDGTPPFPGGTASGTTHAADAPVGFWPSTYYDEVMADAPTAYFRLGESSGTAALDAVGGASGTYVTGSTLGRPSLVPSDPGTAVALNGTTGYVTVADRAALDLGDTFTLEAWVRLTSTYLPSFIDKGRNGYILRATEEGRVLLRKNNAGDIVTSTVALVPQATHHIVAMKTGSTTARLYIDGLDVTGTVTNQTIADTALELNIGAADGGTMNPLAGTIDEVALYRTALSEARVKAHHRAGIGAIVSRWSGSRWEDGAVDVHDGTTWRRPATITLM